MSDTEAFDDTEGWHGIAEPYCVCGDGACGLPVAGRSDGQGAGVLDACYGRTNGGNPCELPPGHYPATPHFCHVGPDSRSWMSWTDEAMAGFAKTTVEFSSDRKQLEDHARELGCYTDPEVHTDQELLDAIAAEDAATEWLQRYERLQTDAMRREAAHRLHLIMEAEHQRHLEGKP